MTSLPITPNAPQAASVSKQTGNAADNGDSQNTQPFGDVLARQISEPNTKDAKTGSKLADALDKLGMDANGKKKDAADTTQADAIPADNKTALPADMLAALMPQAINTVVTSVTPATSAKSASTAGAVDTSKTAGAVTALKTDIASGIQTGGTAKAELNAGENRGAPVKDQSFAAAFNESANRTTGGPDLNAAARDAFAIATAATAAAPQSNAAALASLQNTAASVAAPALQPVQVTINTPVNQAKWNDEFTQKITWLASSKQDQTAELHLNPPHLGPVDVVIKVSGDQATALFTSPHAAVREAIEQAMPRLRDTLADNGIMLGNATVSDQTPRDQGQSNTSRTSAPVMNDIRDAISVSNATPQVSQITRHNGIVDTFA